MKASIIFALAILRINSTFAHLKGTNNARDESLDSTTVDNSHNAAEAIQKELAHVSSAKTIAINNNSRRRLRKYKQPSPQELCSAYMIYDYLTRKMERDSPLQNDGTNIDWSSACPPLHDLNPHICPSGQYLDDICSSRYRIHLNPSVRYEYCKPLLGGIEDEEDRDDCVKACVRYVSRDRGDCCKFECEEEVRTRL